MWGMRLFHRIDLPVFDNKHQVNHTFPLIIEKYIFLEMKMFLVSLCVSDVSDQKLQSMKTFLVSISVSDVGLPLYIHH